MISSRHLIHAVFLFALPIIVAWFGLTTGSALALTAGALVWRWLIVLSRFVVRDKRPAEMESGRREQGTASAPRTRRTDYPGIEDEILTSREACELLKIGRTKLWELTKTSVIPAYRVGTGKTSSLRYKRSELLEWLERNRI